MSAPFHKGRKLGSASWTTPPPPSCFLYLDPYSMLCTVPILGAGPPNPQLKIWNMYITDMDNLRDTFLTLLHQV